MFESIFVRILDITDNIPVNYRIMSKKLKYSFYDDNCVTFVSSTVKQDGFTEHTENIMLRDSFNLIKRKSNVHSQQVSYSFCVTELFWLLWDLDWDMVMCNFIKISKNGNFNKRLIFSSCRTFLTRYELRAWTDSEIVLQ